LLLALLVVIPTSHADNEGAYQAEAQQITQGLQSFATALSGLDSTFTISGQLPYAEIKTDGSEDLRLASVFTDALAGIAPTSVHDLEQKLNFTKTVPSSGGVQAKFTTTITPHAPDAQGGFNIDLGIDLSRSSTAPLKFSHSQLDFKGGSLPTQFALATGDVTTSTVEKLKFRFDPGAPVAQRLSVVTTTTPLLEASVDFGSATSFTPFEIGVGFSRAKVSGTAASKARLRATLRDPDGNGKITESEWTSTAASDLFAFSCVTSTANLGLSLDAAAIGSTVIGGTLTSGAVTVSDTDVCAGLDTPTVTLGSLGDFKNITAEDFLNGVAQVSSAIRALETNEPVSVQLPFLREKTADIVQCDTTLRKFLKDVGVWGGQEPLEVKLEAAKLDPTAANNLASIQSIAPQLATSLGMTVAQLNVRYGKESGTNKPRLLVDVKAKKAPTATNGTFDYGFFLRGVGLSNITAASTPVVTSSCNLDFPIAIDLSAPLAAPAKPPSILERTSIITNGSTPEYTADAPVAARLDHNGTIGFLEVKFGDGKGTGDPKTPLLTRRNPGRPMFTVDLDDGKDDDDKLTIQELFDILNGDPGTTGGVGELVVNNVGIFNGTTPKFSLFVDTKVDGQTVQCGSPPALPKIDVKWDDVVVGVPIVDADKCYKDKLFSFDFGLDDPKEIAGLVLEALGVVADELDKFADGPDGAVLQEELPLIGKTGKELIADFRSLKTAVENFIATPTRNLTGFQTELAARMAEAIGVPAQAETACTDVTDNDGDGFINDGCPTKGPATTGNANGNPEVGDACLDDKDENRLGGTGANAKENREGDATGTPPQPLPDEVNDGCPARANGQSMLKIELAPFNDGGDGVDPPNDTTPNDVGASLIFRLGFGICGKPNPPSTTLPNDCTLRKDVSIPLNLDTPVLGGIGQVEGTGELNLYYEGIVDLNFGVELPRLVEGKPPARIPADNHPSLEAISNALAAERQCQLAGGSDGCSGDYMGTFETETQTYFNDVIKPKFDKAIQTGATLQEISDALSVMLSIERQAQLLGAAEEDCDTLAGFTGELETPTCTGLLAAERLYLAQNAKKLYDNAHAAIKKQITDAVNSTKTWPDPAAEKELNDAATLAVSWERQRQLLGTSDESIELVAGDLTNLMNAFFTRVVKPHVEAAKTATPVTDPANIKLAKDALGRIFGLQRQAALLGNTLDATTDTYLSDASTVILSRYANVTPPKEEKPEQPKLESSLVGPRLFLLDTTGVKLLADFRARAKFSAAFGPLTVSVGDSTLTGETSCGTDTADNDKDGFINDGCPVAGPSGQNPLEPEKDADCADEAGGTLDDDGDGAVNDGCPKVADEAEARLRAQYKITKDIGANNTEDRLNIDTLANLTNHLKAMVPVDNPATTDVNEALNFRPTTQVRCAGDTNPYDACASLPIYYDLDPTDTIDPELLCRPSFNAKDITRPKGDSTTTPATPAWGFTGLSTGTPNCVDELAAKPLDWFLWWQGIKALSKSLETALSGASYNVKVPVIGEALDGGANIVKTFNTDIVPKIDELAKAVRAIEKNGYGDIETKVQDFLFANIGTFLRDWNRDGTVDKKDINLIGVCNDGEPDTTKGDKVDGDTRCISTHAVGHIKDIQLRISIGQDVLQYDLPKFDIGFPGLRLATSDKLKVGVGWRLDLAAGIDRANGFYLATDKQAPARTSELSVDASVKFPAATSTKPSFEGELAFIRLDITDNTTAAAVSTPESGNNCENSADDDGDGTANDGCPADLNFNLGANLHGGNERPIYDPPTDAPSAAASGSGNLNGSYTYKVTFVDGDNGESVPGPASTGVAAANNQVNLTNIQIGPPGTEKRRVYRSNAGGPYKLVKELADNSTTSFTDNVANGSEGATAPTANSQKQHRLELNDLLEGREPTDPAQFTVTAGGGVKLNLQLDTQPQIPGLSSQPGSLPALRVKNFVLDWSFQTGSADKKLGALGTDNTPRILLNGVELDLGKWASDFLRPILLEVQKYTKPMQPVIDFVTTPIPVLDEVFAMVGQEPPTLLRILELQQQAQGNQGSLDMIKRLIYLIGFVNSVPSGKGNIPVKIGDFPILQGNARNGLASAESIMGTPSALGNVLGQLNNVAAGLKEKVEEAQGSKGGFSFPAFQQPTQLVQFLLGKEVVLAQYDTGVLSADFSTGFKVGPPIGWWPASISGTLTGRVEGRFFILYDTAGIREVFRIWFDGDPDNNDILASAAALFHGIGVSDLDAQGKNDVAEIKATLSGVLSAKVIDVVFASAGVDGGIYGRLDLNLHDGLGDPAKAGTLDGVLRIDEIVSRISNPICLFDTAGEVDARARVFVEIDPPDPLPDYTLFEHVFGRGRILDLNGLTADCFKQKPPELATMFDSSGNPTEDASKAATLRLNMGPHAAVRNFKAEKTDEKFVVRQLNPDGKKFSVTFAGLTMEYPKEGFASSELKIFADGGGNKDTIDLQPGGTKLEPGKDPVQATVPFTAPANLCGGPGDDLLSAGSDNDTLVGDGAQGTGFTCSTTENTSTDGADTILAGEGTDTVTGGAGADLIKGEGGNDPALNGGSGSDIISGGFGADTINGQNDVDTLTGGPELDPASTEAQTFCSDNKPETPCVTAADVADTIQGGDGNDTITGEPGNDTLRGGNNDDKIRGTVGADNIFGEGGNDELFGEDGADTIEGGDNDDKLFGEAGDDTLKGGANDDILIGGVDAGGSVGDTLEGGLGADFMLGDKGSVAGTGAGRTATLDNSYAGRDVLKGDGGDDRMWGQGANDVMEGGSENDTMFGAAGDDDMKGEAGDDTMNGDDGTDTMSGGSGKDSMYGGALKDTMDGDGEDDTMYGDSGLDDMSGGLGADTMRGGIDADFMEGDGGGDFMFGEDAADEIYGNGKTNASPSADGGDTIHGDAADDDIEGNGGGDTIYGDAGQDDILGGTSSAGAADGGDTIYGADSAAATDVAGDWDVVIGDNGTIARPGGTESDGSIKRDVTLFDVASTTAGGPDQIHGEEDEDRLFGGGQSDTVNGGTETDHVEGNGGSDTLNGNEDDDDLIGGTSRAASDLASGGGTPDAGDTIHGNDGVDYVVGDNAELTRQSPPAIVLYDLDNADDGLTPDAAYSGDDTLFGDAGADILYGQGANDTMSGGAGDDYMEGNTGKDTLNGDAGLDDMLGGSGHDDGGQGGAVRLLQNIVDDNVGGVGDAMNGGDDIDFMAGDNANITRPTGQRLIALYDVAFADKTAPSGELAGEDTMSGNEGDDVMYGQGDDDSMSGNENDDYMEGNSGRDTMQGNADQDDMLGGSGVDDGGSGGSRRELRNVVDENAANAPAGETQGDQMQGGAGVDYVAGDNAKIARPGGTNSFDSSAKRDVTLYDIQVVGGTAVAANVSGADAINGNGGNDHLFGQGNGPQSGDPIDPPDGVDNDRDGREDGDANDAADLGFDCNDGVDNDNNPSNEADQDAADAQCAAARDEDSSPFTGDLLHGNEDDDYVEGNHGSDWVFGDESDDDLIGGSSAGSDGVVGKGNHPTNLEDGHDVIDGNADDDEIVGDNATIDRPLTDGQWRRLQQSATETQLAFDLVVRDTTMGKTAENAGAFGDDYLQGSAGEDDIFGGLGRDYGLGNAGEDALVGDLGNITNRLEDGSRAKHINPEQPFIDEDIFAAGTLTRIVELYSADTSQAGAAGGADLLIGHDGNDSIHGGPGNDLANGERDEDRVFGGDGNDRLFGGMGPDHAYGGYGNDLIDVHPRPYLAEDGNVVAGSDSPPVVEVGSDQSLQGLDIDHGGWDQDGLQANLGRPGNKPGDRLIDWVGTYNVFYVCPGLYGEWIITRAQSPGMIAYLQDQALGDGALDPATAGSSGFRELGIVFHDENGENAQPVIHPGHFTCPPLDLTATALTTSSEAVTAGDDVTVTATVSNLSSERDAQDVVVRFTANGKEIGRQTITQVEAGTTAIVETTWSARNLMGDYELEATIDPDNTISEAAEDNNSADALVTVGGTDVALAASDLQLSSTKIVQGDKVKLTATVRNPSGAPAYDVAVRFSDNGAVIGREQTIATIPAGGAGTATVTWHTRASAGQRTVEVEADPANTIAELDEANNSARTTVTVTPNKVKNGTFDASATGTAPDNWTASSSTSTAYTLVGEGDWFVSAGSSSFWLTPEPICVEPGMTYGVGVLHQGGMATFSVKQYSSTGRGVATKSFVLPAVPAQTAFSNTVTIDSKAAYATIMLIGGVSGVATAFENVQLWELAPDNCPDP
jgi:Ca2+-binding RTX toxin-like protein